MKRNSLLSKILVCAVCAVLLIAPLSTVTLATEVGESMDDPIIINRLPYTSTQSFYKVAIGETEDGEQIYEDHLDFYFKYTVAKAGRVTVEVTSASEVTCYATVFVGGENRGSANSSLGMMANVDVQVGDVVTIQFGAQDVTDATIKVTISDFPAGSQYNPKKITFADIKKGLPVNLAAGEGIYYTWTATETGVIKFTTTDAFRTDGDDTSGYSMPFQQQIVFNGDTYQTFTSFLNSYKLSVKKGDTISMLVECPNYAVAGGYTLHAEYVPPFVLSSSAQATMFNGFYEVVAVSSQDGSEYIMFAVEFNNTDKTVSAIDMKNDDPLGTYNFNYNTKNGELELTDDKGNPAPYTISVVEDETAPLGAYLKLYYNGGYRLNRSERVMEPSDAIKQLLTGRYERWSFGAMRETFVFDYESGTVIIAKDWESEGTVYTMASYNVFSGELLLTAEGKSDITLIAIGGVIIKGNYELVPVEEPHVHSYASEEVVPTCTEAGYTIFTCECGETYTEEGAAALGHSYETVVTAPTCTEGGYTTNTCSACGDVTTTDQTEATGHSYESVVTAPTCTEGGYTTNTCSVCGDVTTTDRTEATGHSYETVVTAPTCTEQGFTTYTCDCGYSYIGNYVSALNHSYKTVVTAPTCTEQGYTTYTCDCGDSYVDDYLPATGHSYGNWEDETPASCTEEGLQRRDCAHCDAFETQKTAATGHDWDEGKVTKEPTETEKGEKLFTCENCGQTKTESIAELGHIHNYTAQVTAPTCTEQGYTTHACVCGDSYTDSYVAALGHSYKAVVTAPTCTEQGYTTYTCAACGDSNVNDYTAAQGHNWDDGIVTAPTCTEGGYTTRNCTVCGTQTVDHQTNAKGHTYQDVVTAPTCTEGGYTTRTCSACGDQIVSNKTNAKGHAYQDVVTAPTCTEGGYTTRTCSVCGDQIVSNKTNAKGHAYQDVVTAPTCTEGGYTTHTCAACGEQHVDSLTEATGHSYDDGVLNAGITTFTCTVCGHSYTEGTAMGSFQVPGSLNGVVNGTMDFAWVATENGYLIIDNVSSMTGIYTSVTINGATAYPTENGYAVSLGDEVLVTVTTYSELEINVPVYMYEEQGSQEDDSPMEFDVTFSGWDIYEKTWTAPFSGTVTFVITQTNVNASDLTFRVIGVDGQFYNQYEFDLDVNGNQFVMLKVNEGDVLIVVAYEDTMKIDGQLHISVMEGAPELHEHTYDEGVVTAPTCTTDGYTTYTCTGCGESYIGDKVKASHSYESVVTAPTCTEDGYSTYTCSACGDSYKEDGDKALQHSFGEWEVVKEATTTEPGSRKRTCVRCGTEETEQIPMIETTPTTTPEVTEPQVTEPNSTPATTAPATQPATTGSNNVGQQQSTPAGLIIVIATVVLSAGAVAVVIILKKKK